MKPIGKEQRQPFLVTCKPCGHVWPVAWLPMGLAACGKLMKAARCPMCAADGRSIFLASEAHALAWEAARARG